MATTSTTYTGNGSNRLFTPIGFPYLNAADVDVYVNSVLKATPTDYSFSDDGIEFVTAPAAAAVVLIKRSTNDTAKSATFFSGSTIRATDLNNNFDQALYIAQETANQTDVVTTQSANATTTANTASSNASAAVATANTANTTANTALNTANTAITAVASSIVFSPVAAVANIPASPTNGQGVQVENSTGIESFTPLTGKPVGFVGDAGLNVKIQYTTSGSTWNWIGYAPNDSDTRYLKQTGIALGSNTTPSLTFTGDTNTGIYSPGADQVAISTAGSGRLFIDSSGRVGIGTAPDSTLHVLAGEVAGLRVGFNGTSVNYYDAGTQIFRTFAGTERLRIDSSGRVGIGTSSPQSLLHIEGGSVNQNLIASSGNAVLRMADSVTSATRKEFTITLDNTNNRVDIQAVQQGVATRNITLNAGGGNVGIGTTSPNAALDVVGSMELGTKGASNTTTYLDITSDTTYTDYGFRIIRGGTANGNTQLINRGTGALELNCVDGGFLGFSTSNTERARIDSSGRLLVGTSTSRSNAFGQAVHQVEGTNTNAFSSVTIAENSAFGGAFVLAKSRGTAFQILSSGDNLGILSFQGADGSALREAARIDAQVDGTPGANDMPGRLVFSTTADGAATPTEALRITSNGVLAYNQPTPTSKAAAATLTVAELQTRIIQYTGIAATLTLPTGTLTEGGFSGIYTNMTFEWSVINTGSGICTIGAGATHTIVGGATIAVGASGRFATRRTAANTFVSYRLS
jgi:hypothetical protein